MVLLFKSLFSESRMYYGFIKSRKLYLKYDSQVKWLVKKLTNLGKSGEICLTYNFQIPLLFFLSEAAGSVVLDARNISVHLKRKVDSLRNCYRTNYFKGERHSLSKLTKYKFVLHFALPPKPCTRNLFA